jgi:hypothetical protein
MISVYPDAEYQLYNAVMEGEIRARIHRRPVLTGFF